MRLPASRTLPVAALLLAGGYGIAVEAHPERTDVAQAGPAADYPVTIGDPFDIEGVRWTPVDQLNYDAVGYAKVQQEGLPPLTGAHKTLPLPSYVEVTALDSGRTIVIRLVERGPMVNDSVIALAPSAAEQLGVAKDRAAVRVRRVNPPEVERSRLRTGEAAPRRMDTPESLLKVLRRKLADQTPKPAANVSSAAVQTSKPAAIGVYAAEVKASSGPISSAAPLPPTVSRTQAAASAERQVTGRNGTLVVQVAAFSAPERADKVAKQLDGHVTQAGRYWRVRLGPFIDSGEAAPALEKARAAGYSDARIQRAD
ncbi:SPOR domain-containing protein [Novosphingobium sp. M1R2S20]|uniref:SPOR domain-containing protein n=1 Tax=Novosphingobium rhizovicinum TaxID=3228928 RepID=A0ABV3R7F3_9SPHN